MLVVALPTIAQELGTDIAATSWLITAYLIAMASLQPLGGRFGDRFGRRRVMLGSLLYFGVVSALAPLAADIASLTLIRLNQAVSLSLFGPNALALLRDEIPERGRGAQFGLVSGAAGFGAALGPPLGGVLAAFDWRWLFLVNVPITLGVLALAWRALPRRAAARDRSLDLAGGLWLTALLVVASLLLTSASETPITPAWLAMSLAVIAGSALFMWYEGRQRDPVLPLRLFRALAFSAATAGVALSNFAMYLPLLVIPLLLANEGNAAASGAVLGAYFVAQIVLAPLGGRLSDGIGRRATVLVGSVVTAVGLALVAPRAPG
ncbi:MAG: MFS transporter, partial [Candidatus Limnocylindria bacterium]